ncbi:MAG: 3-deoxy-7-phosphoheptulonate synthase [Planctomycetota bacterium]
MIIVLKPNATSEQVERAVALVNEMGLKEHVIAGTERTVIACVGDERFKDPGRLASLDFVDDVKPVLAPYKMASRETRDPALGRTVVPLGGTLGGEIGGTTIPVIGGPCSVESKEQTMESAHLVKAGGGVALRGGAFKPRTNPYSFQGHGEKGLEYLAEARQETGLGIVTEVMSIDQVDLVCEYADVMQIGARNCQNFNLLAAVGERRKPVLLKRGMSQTLEEFLLAAEYILARGNEHVILCERGIRTFEDYVRNTLPLAIVPELQRLSHLPVMVDPSHGTGKAHLVTPMARAAIAAGADGIIVEMHPDPQHAMTDGGQSLTGEQFKTLVDQCRRVASAVDREL